MTTVNLHGRWQLSDASGAHNVPFDLPGDGITALHKGGVLPDPYWGRNEYECRWVCERDWIITRTVELDRTDLELVTDFVDTVAEVRLNGVVVLEAANMYRRFRADVSEVARIGSNEIEICFRSPVAAGAEIQETLPFRVPHHARNSPIPNGNMLRKPQCDFGWDWNIALASFGIYGRLDFVPKEPFRFGDVHVEQSLIDGAAHVTIDVNCIGAPPSELVDVSLCGTTQSAAVEDGFATVHFVIDQAELWWPAGLGAQTLHDVVISCGPAAKQMQLGLCDIKLISEPDEAGRNFKFNVNGRDVFALGTNWIPADALGSGITENVVRDLLQSAVDANMNMIRIWGGGRYEPDWFYDLCDELGLMVWQDFMFACNLYPSTNEFLAEIKREVRDVVGRIDHHACLAVWCGDNELIGALDWFDESMQDRDRYLVSYDRLNRALEETLLDVAPNANWWPSSPSPGPMNFGDAWHDDSSGDMHFWSVWHEGRDLEHYRDVAPRFCSEFGFQSYPSMDVVRTFADEVDQNIASPVMESHQKNVAGNARIAETMFRYVRFPNSFEDFVYVSQVQQGLAIKTAVTHWRGLKPHCMGTLYWQLNDTWPVASWASLDYGGGWKLLHHMAREFYAPLTVVIVPETDQFIFKGVNDGLEPAGVKLSISAFKTDGTLRHLTTNTGEVGTEASHVLGKVAMADLAGDEILFWHWKSNTGQSGSDFFAPKPFKSFDLQAPDIAHQVSKHEDHFHIALSAQRPAFFVSLEADQPGRFSQNGFLLLPGQNADVRFTPKVPSDTPPRITIRDLHSSTYPAS